MPSRPRYPANRNGLPFGEYVVTSLGYPGRVAGRSDALRTFVEAWGDSHESGYESTATLEVISRDEFFEMCIYFEQDPGNIHDPRLRRWQMEQ